MRLYGVLTMLGVAGAVLICNAPTAHADTSKGHSLLLAQNQSKLTTQNNQALLSKRGTSGILPAQTDETESKEESVAVPVASQPEVKAEKEQTVTVAAGESLAMIAERYNTTWTRLFDANVQLSNPDVINPGDTIRIPKTDEVLPDRSSQVVAAQQAAASTASASAASAAARTYTTQPVNSSSYYVGNGMWCTDYVHSRRPDVAVYGNAGYNWISSAQAAGKSTGSAPQAGAVAVTNGHVAYVESVNADGSYVVSEMGWNYRAGNYNKRTVQPGTFGQFIY